MQQTQWATTLWRVGFVAMLGWACPAFALGLGDINVQSSLNQRFQATIALTDVSAADAANISLELAPAQAYQKAGVERSSYLSSLRFQVRPRDNGYQVAVSSSQIAKEPYIGLILEARSGNQRVQRQYAVLLDPPNYALSSAPSAAPVATSDNHPSAERSDAAASPARSYGPIAPNETLWRAATHVRPKGVSMDQVMLALYETNPDAFEDGQLERLRKGAVLNVPDVTRMQSVSAKDAQARINALRSKPVAPAPATAPPKSKPQAKPEKAPSQPKPTPEQPAPSATPPVTKPTAAAPTATQASASQPIEVPAAASPVVTLSAETASALAESTLTSVADPAASSSLLGSVPLMEDAVSGVATDASSTVQQITPIEPIEPIKPYEPPPLPSEQASDTGGDFWSGSMAPLAGLAAALVLVFAWRVYRRRQSATPATAAVAKAAPVVAAAVAPDVPRDGDTFAETASTAASPNVASRDDRHESVAPPAVPLNLAPPVTVDSQKIDLSQDDPIAEADFHLAYGLFDEAALQLKQALLKQPQRVDVAFKLAEVYHQAGKTTDFAALAEDLMPRVGESQRRQLVEWGQGLNVTLESAQAVPRIEPTPSATPAIEKASPSLDMDLSAFEAAAATPRARVEPQLPNPEDIRLDDFDQMPSVEESGDISTGDESSTKLDLARAYVDMGDNETARGLLNEVMQQGNSAQKAEAQTLLTRLS